MNLRKSFKRILSFKEDILPKFCNKNSSIKYELDSFSSIVRCKISTDGKLKLFQEMEKIKFLLLDEKKLILFDYMENQTLQENLNKIYLKLTMNNSEILNIFR